ncbi:MAG: asparagine synthase (glutamine-hydrolyzing) [Isosphaeraceae bacterium]
MCGIAGIIGPGATSEDSRRSLAAMTAALAPRGPDEESHWFDPAGRAAFGFRRLAILDVPGGHQPAANEDVSVHVVFNGEIYNFPELQQRLQALGHRLSGRGDTATLPHLFEEEKKGAYFFSEAAAEGFFERLRGMFAIAVWDSASQTLLLGRDRFGQKPLVYRFTADGQLHFASELKALRAADPCWKPAIDPVAVDQYLALGHIPAPLTIYQGVYKLPAAHFAILHNGQLTVKPYWQVDWSPKAVCRELSFGQAASRLSELLDSAVAEQNVADVPIGVFLSGGIDSSAIAALSARAVSQPIRSFSVAFDDVAFDESPQAEAFARQIGAYHTTIRVDFNAWETLQALAMAYDEPLADNSALPTWLLARETARHVRVVLSGDGGDELALGYDRYRALSLIETTRKFLPRSVLQLISGPLARRIPVSARAKTRLRRVRSLLQSLGSEDIQAASRWLLYWDEPGRLALYRPDFLDQLVEAGRQKPEPADPLELIRAGLTLARGRSLVRQSQAADVSPAGYLSGDLMFKVDIATMAHSLECRSPFLDHRLAEFGATLPDHFWLSPLKRTGKRLLKHALADVIPPEVFARRKMGFGAPVDRWLRGPLASRLEELLTGPESRISALFNLSQIRNTIAEHRDQRTDHAYRLWSLLMLELWLRNAS